MAKILVVDDEEPVRELMRRALEYEGHTIFQAEDSIKGFELFKKSYVDLVITDMMMPEGDGFSLVSEIAQIAPNTRIIIVSGWFERSELDALEDEFKSCVRRVMTKPFGIDDLRKVVSEVLKESAYK